MGTFENGINGPFRGRVGHVVGSKWRSINYMKSLPRARRNKRPPTPQQALQHQKLTLLNQFLRNIRPYLETGFRQYTGRATGVNAACHFNFDHAFLLDDGKVSLNYPALKFSHGSLYTAGDERAWRKNDGIQVTWHPKTYGMGGAPDDIAFLFAYSPEQDIFYSTRGPVVRQDGSAYIPFDGDDAGREVHLWLFFADNRRTRVSNTVYIPLSDPPAPEDQ